MRVNGREYTSDTPYATAELARDKAAESAYMICRNFSVNDGMYPGQKHGQGGIVQGLPVAIGTGRRARSHKPSTSGSDSSCSEGGSSSGESSPRTSDTELDAGARRTKAPAQATMAVCHCRRAYVTGRYGRCEYCMRESGWYA